MESSSTSSPRLEVELPDLDKCRICDQTAHGHHFGALTCRACAAFFRRCHFANDKDIWCRKKKEMCKPDSDKKWNCKKCRLNKCLAEGMTERNIQYDRDAFSSLITFKNSAKRKMESQIPITVETFLRIPHIIGYLKKDMSTRPVIMFLDISHIVKKASDILKIGAPCTSQDMEKLNDLEQLELGLKDYRASQLDVLLDGSNVTKEGAVASWEDSLCSVARWLTYSQEIRQLSFEVKMELLQCAWIVWGKLERMAMTAQMRVNRLCAKKQFVVDHRSMIDYDRMHADISWWSSYRFEELQFLFTPDDLFYDHIVTEIMEVQPDSVELTYLLCNLCLGLTGRTIGGSVEEIVESLQEKLADNLHEYYLKREDNRYAFRLKQLMRINEHFLIAKNKRGMKYEVCSRLDIIKSNISNKEFFRVSC